MSALLDGGLERRRHPRRNIGRPEFLALLRAYGGLDRGDRLGRHVVLAEIPEGGERQACRLADELKPPAVRGVYHPDRDVADSDRAARRAGMEHRHGRHLGAEPEPPRGFRAVNLDSLAIVPGDGLYHLEDAGDDIADEPALAGSDVDAAGETLDFAFKDETRKGPVDGAARSAIREARGREGLALGQASYTGSNGFRRGHDKVLAVEGSWCPKI